MLIALEYPETSRKLLRMDPSDQMSHSGVWEVGQVVWQSSWHHGDGHSDVLAFRECFWFMSSTAVLAAYWCSVAFCAWAAAVARSGAGLSVKETC